MKILKRTFWAVTIIVLLYWLGYFVLGITSLRYRSWVHFLGRTLTYLVFPLLCILMAAGWLEPLLARGKIIKVALGIIIGGIYLIWCYWLSLIILFTHQAEERLTDDLLVTNEAIFLEEAKYVYYRPIAFFFKMPFALDAKSHIEYLEEKYDATFVAVGENLYVNEDYPTIEASVYIQDVKMEDNYVNAMWIHYFEMWYKEAKPDRKYYVQKNKEGLAEWIYLELRDEDDMEGLAADVSALMQYVARKTDFFEEHYVPLYFYYEIDRRRLTGYLPFGAIEKWGEGKNDYYLYPEQILVRIRAEYESNIDHLAKEKGEYKDESEETDSKDELVIDTTPEQMIEEVSLEDMARFVFDEILAEQGYLFQVKYNAKGYAYIDLGSGPAEDQEDIGIEEFYRYTLVYDRTSENGLCELFVLYKEHYTEDGINDITSILDMYAVEKDSGRVIVANKQLWSDLGTAEYREATGE